MPLFKEDRESPGQCRVVVICKSSTRMFGDTWTPWPRRLRVFQEVAVRIGAVVLVIWLVIGVVATVQRGYFSGSDANCAEIGTTALTVVAGPLNYVGVNPKIKCETPVPST